MANRQCPSCKGMDTAVGLHHVNCFTCGDTFPFSPHPTETPTDEPGDDPSIGKGEPDAPLLGDKDTAGHGFKDGPLAVIAEAKARRLGQRAAKADGEEAKGLDAPKPAEPDPAQGTEKQTPAGSRPRKRKVDL